MAAVTSYLAVSPATAWSQLQFSCFNYAWERQQPRVALSPRMLRLFRLSLMKPVRSSPITYSLFRSWEHSLARKSSYQTGWIDTAAVTTRTIVCFFFSPPFMSKHCSLTPTIWSLKCHLTAWKRDCRCVAVACCSSYWWVNSKWSTLMFLCWLLLPNSAGLTFPNLNQENMEMTRLWCGIRSPRDATGLITADKYEFLSNSWL